MQTRTKVSKPFLSHSGGFLQYRIELEIAIENARPGVGLHAFLETLRKMPKADLKGSAVRAREHMDLRRIVRTLGCFEARWVRWFGILCKPYHFR